MQHRICCIIWSFAPVAGAAGTPQKEATEEESTAGKWDEFQKRIEIRGDNERSFSEEEVDHWLGRLSEEETESLIARLESMRFQAIFARGIRSVLEDAFSLVAAVRWQLMREPVESKRWRQDAALHMFLFADALGRVIEAARDVEKETGYSGQELAEE